MKITSVGYQQIRHYGFVLPSLMSSGISIPNDESVISMYFTLSSDDRHARNVR